MSASPGLLAAALGMERANISRRAQGPYLDAPEEDFWRYVAIARRFGVRGVELLADNADVVPSWGAEPRGYPWMALRAQHLAGAFGVHANDVRWVCPARRWER